MQTSKSFQPSDWAVINVSSTPVLIASIIIIFFVIRSLYRLYLHPLAGIPGPKLAALTGLYEAYFDNNPRNPGRFWVQISRLHEIYGPIVRISPWEVHIRDHAWAASNEGPYRFGLKTRKPRRYYANLGKEESVNSSYGHDAHKMRREAAAPFFRTENVVHFGVPLVERLVETLIGRLRAARDTELGSGVVDLGVAFRALTTDAASGFVFGGADLGNLRARDFSAASYAQYRRFTQIGVLARQFPGLQQMIRSTLLMLPKGYKPKRMAPTSDYFASIQSRVLKDLEASEKGVSKHSLVLQLRDSCLPESEKGLYRIAKECSMMVLAGTETTGNTLSSAVFYLLNDLNKEAKLRDELANAEATRGRKPSYRELRELPYLTAVINETLRLANSIFGRHARECEDTDLHYGEHTIPKGTVISTTTRDTHLDPTIYPQPESFIPERWLDNPEPRLKTFLRPFGRGARACIGIDLAYVSLYLALGRLFSPSSKVEMELFQTELRDIEPYHDFLVPYPITKTGLRVLPK